MAGRVLAMVVDECDSTRECDALMPAMIISLLVITILLRLQRLFGKLAVCPMINGVGWTLSGHMLNVVELHEYDVSTFQLYMLCELLVCALSTHHPVCILHFQYLL